MNMREFLATMPKAELHLHLEGTVSAAKVMELSKRNGIDIPYASEEALIAAQDYGTPALENFLKYHHTCSEVIRTERDVYEIARDCLDRCRLENIRHVELSFDPIAFINRGVSFDATLDALNKARRESDVSSQLIMCVNRARTLEIALEMLDMAKPYRNDIVGVGLVALEAGNPPMKFREFYERARREGYRLTAHCDCDQENAVEHARQCIHDLRLDRIDHGLHVLDDDGLIEEARARNITLTMCPTWRPSDAMPRRLPALRKMLDLGLSVCLNSDDPEEFASRYLTNIMIEVQRQGGFSAEEMTCFMRHAFAGSWLSQNRKDIFLKELDSHLSSYLAQ